MGYDRNCWRTENDLGHALLLCLLIMTGLPIEDHISVRSRVDTIHMERAKSALYSMRRHNEKYSSALRDMSWPSVIMIVKWYVQWRIQRLGETVVLWSLIGWPVDTYSRNTENGSSALRNMSRLWTLHNMRWRQVGL